MKSNGSALIAAGVAALLGLSSISFAQAPGGTQQPRQGRGQGGQRGQGRQATLTSFPVEVMEKLLKLTADQKTKISAIQTKLTEDTRALRPQQGQQRDPESRKKLTDANNAARTQIEAVLTDEQKKKLPTVMDEVATIRLAGAPVGMIGELKFSDDQKKKLADMRKENTEKMRGLSPEERRTKGREMQQEMRTKVESMLTAEQKAQIEKYRKDNPRQGRNRPNPPVG